ncbi:hypothetical protein LJR260_003650 [Variovorax paradoxus]|uniref:hypothetical protein n=1 Tax=Variovorax paradoxus TaxID=34073 RepID=UPI003ECD3066
MSDLAEELNISLPWLRQALQDKGAPKLVPDLRAGLLNLYGDDTAERWLAAYRAWREEEPARKAAKRAEIAARAKGEMEAEMTRIATEQKVARAMQEATDTAIAEEAARQERALKGIW